MTKWIGVLAAVGLVIAGFFPWVIIESHNITVTGIESTGTNFGKPAYFHFFMAACFLVFSLINHIWAKRVNMLVAAINISWAARNYFVISACSGGDCPSKQAALFVVVGCSALMIVAALTPKMRLPAA